MKVNNCFVLRTIYGKHLLFPTRANEVGNELISLNEVGADIWNLAVMGLTEDQIISHLVKIYNLEVNSVEENSIRLFIASLCEQKLLFREV